MYVACVILLDTPPPISTTEKRAKKKVKNVWCNENRTRTRACPRRILTMIEKK